MNKKGFTLIEIAMVLVVIGILLSIGTQMMGVLTKRAKLIDAREVVKTAKEALSGYAVKNGFLPATIAPTGARELDAWQRPLVYALPAALSGSGNACGLTATDRTIYECTNATCSTSNTKPNIAFIVYSTGEDADGAGTTTKPTAAPACPAGTCYWIREQATSDASYTLEYDDIVQYVTLDEIRSARSCAFNITTQTLPDAKVGTAYSVTLQASGGQTPYTSWTTGQAQGACAAGTVQLVATSIGLCLNTSTGVISGTPTSAGFGVNNFTVTLTDASGVTTSKVFTLNIANTLAITNQTLPDAREGLTYNTTLSGTGGTAPYTWSVNGQTAGTFGCAAGTYPITTGMSSCAEGTGTCAGTCTGTCVATTCYGGAGTCTGTCTGRCDYSNGICLNSTTGVLSTATYPNSPGAVNFTVILTDANAKTATQAFTLNVIDPFWTTGQANYNATTALRYYKALALGSVCTTAGTCNTWAIGGTFYILPNTTYCFFTNATCTTVCTTYPSINYNQASGLDANENGMIQFNVAVGTCNAIDR